MFIQNIGSAAPAPTSDSASAPVATPRTEPEPAALPQAVAKPAPEKQAAEPTAAQLQNAVDHINEAMRQSNSNVEFTIDKDTKQTIIKVIESSTGDVIRQYPSEEVLAIARAIDRMQQQQGLLIKQEA